MRLLCSTGVFTRSLDPLSHEVIPRYGPMFDVDGFEVIVYPCWYADLEQIARTLRASGLAFPVIHAEKGIGEAFGSNDPSIQEQGVAHFARNCHFAREIGASLAVLHLWGLPESDSHFERNLCPLARCLDIAESYALELAIETIPCMSSDPLSNVRRAFECDPRSRVALDTEFLAMHSQLNAVFDASWLWQAALVRHVHLKDFLAEGGRFLHPGDGEIDFSHFIRQLRTMGFEGALSLESRGIDSEGNVEVARIEASLELIRNLARAG